MFPSGPYPLGPVELRRLPEVWQLNLGMKTRGQGGFTITLHRTAASRLRGTGYTAVNTEGIA